MHQNLAFDLAAEHGGLNWLIVLPVLVVLASALAIGVSLARGRRSAPSRVAQLCWVIAMILGVSSAHTFGTAEESRPPATVAAAAEDELETLAAEEPENGDGSTMLLVRQSTTLGKFLNRNPELSDFKDLCVLRHPGSQASKLRLEPSDLDNSTRLHEGDSVGSCDAEYLEM